MKSRLYWAYMRWRKYNVMEEIQHDFVVVVVSHAEVTLLPIAGWFPLLQHSYWRCKCKQEKIPLKVCRSWGSSPEGSSSQGVPRTVWSKSAYISISLLPRHGRVVCSRCRMIEISRRVWGSICVCFAWWDGLFVGALWRREVRGQGGDLWE